MDAHPLIAEEFGHVGNRSAAQFQTLALLFGNPLTLHDRLAGRPWHGLAIGRRAVPFFPTQQPFEADALAADLDTAIHLAPDVRFCVEAGGDTVQSDDHVFFDVGRFRKKPPHRATIEFRQARELERGHGSIAALHLGHGGPGQTKSVGRFVLADRCKFTGLPQAPRDFETVHVASLGFVRWAPPATALLSR